MPDISSGQPDSGNTGSVFRNFMRTPWTGYKYFFAILLTPLFAGLASFGAVSFFAFLRTLIFFAGIALFLPIANCLIQSGRKYRTFLILGGAFLAGMIACALAFPLTTSIIPQTCPVHYLLSGGVYLVLFFGVYLLHLRYGCSWLFLFLLAMIACMAGFVFIHIPAIASWSFLGTVAGASLLNAMPVALFLAVLFTWMNPHKYCGTRKKSSIIKTFLTWVIALVLLTAAGILSFSFNGILLFEKGPAFLIAHLSDFSAIRSLSGQLESYDTIILFSPGKKPIERKLQNPSPNDTSKDRLIRILPKKNDNDPSIFQYKGIKQLYSLSPEHRYGFWEGSRYFSFSGDQTWTQLIFHGDASPAVLTFRADAVCPVPGKDAIFYSLDNEFFLQDKNEKKRLIYSAETFFASALAPYSPVSTGFTPGFSHIFYVCWRESILSHSPHFLFIFETATNKFFALDLSENGREYSPLQWKEKK